MTDVATFPRFDFSKNVSLLNHAASLGFDVTSAPPEVLLALASPAAPFPAGDISVATVSLAASTDKPIEFGSGTGKVSFSAKASAFADLGVYRTGATLLHELGSKVDDISLDGIEFGLDASTLLCMLRWGYDVEAKGSGAVALGAIGQATFDIAGSRDGLFAVIRRRQATEPARSVVQTVADSWLMPRQITSLDQVEPGTWLVAEVAGSVSVGLGATVGFDFNWVRQATLGGLTGDIGLRLQLGINGAVGFSSSGRSIVVVSRDTDARALRVRFFRQKTKELDLSFNAALNIQVKPDTLLPGKADDFVAAVFGTHGLQIARDLAVLDKWTDPHTPLATLLANAGVEGAEGLIAHLAGVSVEELQQKFDTVHSTVVSFIDKWHALPHGVASTLLKLVEEKADLGPVKDVVTKLTTISTDDLRSLLDAELNHISFFGTPVGQMLEAIAGDNVGSLLGKPLDDLHEVATKILAILDGSALEDTLKKFQSYVEQQLGVDKILPVVTDTDFAALDALLKTKLADFLGQHVLVLKDLDKIRTAFHLLLAKRQEYYEKALEALHRKYNFSFTAASQSTATDTALFDATFDFSHDQASVIGFLQQAIQGKLDDLLKTQPAQVDIAVGKLTHGVKRQTSIDVSLPFMRDITHVHINDSLATLEAVPHGGGVIFKLKSTDTVTSSNRRKSALSLAMGLAAQTGIRLHQDSLDINYSLLFAKRNMRRQDVRAQVGPAIRTTFKGRIADLETFVDVLDRRVEAAIPNGPNVLGNGLLSLDVTVDPSAAKAVGAAWLGLPVDRGSDVYSKISIAIQLSLKQHIHDSVFNAPDGYIDVVGRTDVFLAYCALAPTAQKPLDWFWNWPDVDERKRLLDHPVTKQRMSVLLTRAQDVLLGDSRAEHFRPERTEEILDRIDPSDAFLNTLLVSESAVVRDALDAGVAIARAMSSQKPSDAIDALESFGANLTEAFHSDITTLLGPGIQSLGTQILLDATGGITGAPLQETSAVLNIEFLRPDVAFDDAALLTLGHAPVDQLGFADRVVAGG